MYSCGIVRKPMVRGHNTYLRYPIKTPQTSWYIRANRPSLANYTMNGSFAARNRRTGCPQSSGCPSRSYCLRK